MSLKNFQLGDPAPWFVAPSTNSPLSHFSSAAGRYVLMLFFGSAGAEKSKTALDLAFQHHALFDVDKVVFFCFSSDGQDAAQKRVPLQPPGMTCFWDFDYKVAKLYGATDELATPGQDIAYRPFWLLLDPMLRVLEWRPLSQGQALLDRLAALPSAKDHAETELSAPVLIMPRIFEPEFCRHLISLWRQHGGVDSAFMRERQGKTAGIIDHSFKRRADHELTEAATIVNTKARILQRLVPEIEKAFHYRVTRMERYLVARYDGNDGGFFKPHRDNTLKGTEHRRFAVTINLNAEEYDGGELRFPEFGPKRYRAPTGGAVVFSCSLLHEALPVTRGERFAFLPFLYDDQAAKQRAAANEHLADGVMPYKLEA